MTETTPAPEVDAAAARAVEQARLRKERREAKIRAGGTARLNKITGLGGGLQRDPQPTTAPTPPSQPTSTPPAGKTSTPDIATTTPGTPGGSTHDDPEEVDISQHFYEPRATNRTATQPDLTEAQLRQMMLGFEQPGPSPGPNPFLPNTQGGAANVPPGMEGLENDPMMKMLQQMMGGGSAGGGGGNPFAGLPGMENLFAGTNGMPGAPSADAAQQQQTAAVTDRSANIWRVVHAAFALGLGLWIALSTTFTGTRAERESGSLSLSTSSSSPHSTLVSGDEFGDPAVLVGATADDELERLRARFFYAFTSVEAVLLTTRYLLDRRASAPGGGGGIVWTLSGFLPGRLGAGVRHALRYAKIFGTVRSDALVCVFVLGVCAWVRS